jgi:hypothetical protein
MGSTERPGRVDQAKEESAATSQSNQVKQVQQWKKTPLYDIFIEAKYGHVAPSRSNHSTF